MDSETKVYTISDDKISLVKHTLTLARQFSKESDYWAGEQAGLEYVLGLLGVEV